jgi:hypothetical protein
MHGMMNTNYVLMASQFLLTVHEASDQFLEKWNEFMPLLPLVIQMQVRLKQHKIGTRLLIEKRP